jgi:hypothetical protein
MFLKETRRENRKIFVNYIFNKLDKINIPNKMIAFLIRSWHFQTPFNFMVGIILLNFRLGCITLLPLIISFFLFFYFDGCFLSIIEYKLDKENHLNIIDPYLIWSGQELNEQNRFTTTLVVSFIYFIIVGFILFYKYKFNY